jgi:hypothetical protein
MTGKIVTLHWRNSKQKRKATTVAKRGANPQQMKDTQNQHNRAQTLCKQRRLQQLQEPQWSLSYCCPCMLINHLANILLFHIFFP